ncbi:MAG: hypothetical protein A2Y38_11320 [Spirochaetes bacterium GWB1_59_5]|nr:MAG: hypothetical protein A2Y38_11320 [Spirochaetes bacterium GWB1_59_5]
MSHRQKLPPERAGTTHRFTLDGFKCYVTVGVFDDGKPGEIFVRIGKVGSTTRQLVDGWAIMVSLALQYGVPLSVILDKFEGMAFEPSGYTEDMGKVKSIFDYLARWMRKKYLPTPKAAKA